MKHYMKQLLCNRCCFWLHNAVLSQEWIKHYFRRSMKKDGLENYDLWEKNKGKKCCGLAMQCEVHWMTLRKTARPSGAGTSPPCHQKKNCLKNNICLCTCVGSMHWGMPACICVPRLVPDHNPMHASDCSVCICGPSICPGCYFFQALEEKHAHWALREQTNTTHSKELNQIRK